ncbi:hypothetical protein GJ744_011881 [Endocarpon pusillum]|uniref:MADS-box domain-containing protein n=1 Tax=Endocarpon pusillum TaxID=364733 RepID=A0A8H7E320_9EURO|nr:hypothetical protein GJ744_011881 [Endocarpon pusillum]
MSERQFKLVGVIEKSVNRQRTQRKLWKRKRTLVGKCDETGRLYEADIYLAVRRKGSCTIYTKFLGPSWPPRGDDVYPVPIIMTAESLRQASRKSDD